MFKNHLFGTKNLAKAAMFVLDLRFTSDPSLCIKGRAIIAIKDNTPSRPTPVAHLGGFSFWGLKKISFAKRFSEFRNS
jgi:hypothetical protein